MGDTRSRADRTTDALEEAFRGSLGSAPGATEEPDWNKRGDDFLRAIYTGDGMPDPAGRHPVLFKGGIQVGSKRLAGGSAVSYMQQQLIKAGLLDPEDIQHPGSPADPATRNAMSRMFEAQRILGTRTVLETVEVLGSQFSGWDTVKQTKRRASEPGLFVPPERTKVSATDVHDIARQVATEIMGQEPSEEQLNVILTKVRAGEQREYEGAFAGARQDYEVREYERKLGDYEQGVTDAKPAAPNVGAITTTQAPSVSSLAAEQFMNSEEGLRWSVLKGLSALIDSMRSG